MNNININNLNNKEIKEPLIYTGKNILMLKEVPVLDNGQIYIYVMLNTQNNIKIGKTTNIQQRLQSLSGSNGGGSKIIKLYCSPAIYIESIEKALHSYYGKNRINGTEWFRDLDFDDVVEHVNNLFYTRDFEVCNELRKQIVVKERAKIAEKKVLEALEESTIEETTSKKSKKNKGKEIRIYD